MTAAWRPSAYKTEAVRWCETQRLVIHTYTSDEDKTEYADVEDKVYVYYWFYSASLSVTLAPLDHSSLFA